MTEHWLIDGYNLLHAATSTGSKKNKVSRESLLSSLSSFASLNQVRVTVVLDGQGNQSELDVAQTHFFRVVYSQKVTADSCIEKMLFNPEPQSRWMVVTNDRAIAQIARGKGSAVFSCDQFNQRIREYEKDKNETHQKNNLRSHGFHRPFEDKLKDL